MGRTTVVRILTSVLLPAPLGPSNPKTAPFGTVRSTSRSACTRPLKTLLTPRSSSAAPVIEAECTEARIAWGGNTIGAVFPTLGAFLAELSRRGEVRRIESTVSPLLEPSEHAQREARLEAPSSSRSAAAFDPPRAALGGRALVFERVEGCDFPLCMNVFGSHRRVEIALGAAEHPRGLEAIADRIAALVQPTPPRSLGELISAARRFAPLLRIPPRRVRSGRCQQVVKLAERGEVDLSRIPLIKCWPHDGDPIAVGSAIDARAAGTADGNGRFITFAGMHTIHADDRGVATPSSHNIGMYRAQLLGRTRLAMHWHMHHDGASHWRSWKKLGERMPIAICFGGESVMAYGATAPLPPGISELLMCGFLNGRGIPMVPAKTVPLRVPANSELVIEGWVDTRCGFPGWDPRSGEPLGDGAVFEGPFGDHTGFYSLPDRYPIVEVTAVTHARDAIIPATVVGPPPQEDYYLGKATERIFLPLLRTLIHDVDDYHLPLFGCFHNAAFVRIRKAYPMQARRVMHSVWGAGQMAWTKMIAVVDDSVDVHDERAVWRRIFERCHFGRDVETVHGPLDILDHAAPWLGAGCKIGFDATGAGESEALHGVPAGAPERPSAVQVHALRAALESWRRESGEDDGALADFDLPEGGLGRCVILAVRKRRAGDGARAIERLWTIAASIGGEHLGDFAIVLDEGAAVRDFDDCLFVLAANIDPGR
ncbi:MAG: UbiD family decarboxylase, partial [Phycisphaerae bacterium]|nr:UbiD family decarboxylase [Phycisphaerae bacterium]